MTTKKNNNKKDWDFKKFIEPPRTGILGKIVDKITRKEKLKQKMFQALMDHYFKGLDYTVDPRERKFRCSQLGKCSRRLFFTNLLGWETGNYMTTASKGGTVIHVVYEQGLEKKFKLLTKTDLKVESTVNKSYLLDIDGKEELFDVKGHVDLLVLEDEDGTIWVIDIKTTDNLENIRNFGAKSDHIGQVIYYVDLLQFTPEQMKKVQPGLLYQYRRKNTGDIFDLFNPDLSELVEVEYDPQIEVKNINQMKMIYTALKDGKLPPIDAELWECNNSKVKCPNWNFCYDKDGNPQPIMDLEHALKNAESFRLDSSELNKTINTPDSLRCPVCSEEMIKQPKGYYMCSNHFGYPDYIKKGLVKERKWKS